MLLFEICPWCSQKGRRECPVLWPMILSDDDKKMHCEFCHRSWKLRDSEALLELARQKRRQRNET